MEAFGETQCSGRYFAILRPQMRGQSFMLKGSMVRVFNQHTLEYLPFLEELEKTYREKYPIACGLSLQFFVSIQTPDSAKE